MVSRHIGGTHDILWFVREGEPLRVRVRLPMAQAGLIAVKGSVALDGISLTVNDVNEDSFGVNIIPYTWDHTNFATLKVGDRMNVEVDVMSRDAARLMSCDK